MIIEHDGQRPRVAASAYVAPTAVVSGDVSIGERSRVLFNAVVTAEGGPVEIGRHCVVMEHALVRGRTEHPVRIGDSTLVGPHAHVNGAVLEGGVFIATGASVFPGARIGEGAEVRINGIVHVNTAVAAGTTVPIGWVAVGDPAQVFPTEQHDEIWGIQERLGFPETVFGLPRPADGETLMPEAMRRYCERFGRHRDDRVVE